MIDELVAAGRRPVRGPANAVSLVALVPVIGYSSTLVLVELSSSLVGALPGALVDAALVPIMLAHFVLRPDAPYRRMYPALALVALLRTLSIAAAVPRLPEYMWYASVGLPILAGAVVAGRLTDEPGRRLGISSWRQEFYALLTLWRPKLDVLIAILGLPAGLVGYLLLRPAALVPAMDVPSVLAAMVILAIFGGFLEEVVYRGVLQTVAIDVLRAKRAGILFAATLGAFMYWGAGSIPFTFAIWLLGVGYGYALVRGASLWGIAASHTIMLWGMGLLWPLLLR